MKQCRKCLKKTPLTEFYRNPKNKDGHRTECRVCTAIYHKSLYDRDKEKLKKRTLAYQRRNPEKRFYYGMKQKYGISKKQYDELVTHNPVCNICGKFNSNNRTKNKLCVDHYHITGKIRGLLCDKCNKGIGLLEDNVQLLEKAVEYLKNA